jgi:hypothetical protein
LGSLVPVEHSGRRSSACLTNNISNSQSFSEDNDNDDYNYNRFNEDGCDNYDSSYVDHSYSLESHSDRGNHTEPELEMDTVQVGEENNSNLLVSQSSIYRSE